MIDVIENKTIELGARTTGLFAFYSAKLSWRIIVKYVYFGAYNVFCNKMGTFMTTQDKPDTDNTDNDKNYIDLNSSKVDSCLMATACILRV